MGDEDEKTKDGGVVLGGISFGVGPGAKEAPRDAQRARPRDPEALGPKRLPLRVLVVAELVPRRELNAGASAPEHAVRVEAGGGLDPLFARLAPRLAIEVDSVLAEGARRRVDLAPDSLKSFRPDELCRTVPILRSLLDGRRVLERLRDGSLDVGGAESELGRLWSGSTLVARVLGGVEKRAPSGGAAAGPGTPAPAQEDAVSRILSMVDAGTKADAAFVSRDDAPTPATRQERPAASGVKGQLDAFIAAITTGRGGARPDQAIGILEQAIGVQLGAILQHPELRRLETAWRGLALLASRLPKEDVQLDVVCAAAEGAPAAIERALALGRGVDPPVSFAVVDDVIDGDAASLARLRALGELAEARAMPIVTNASPALLGHADLASVDRLDNKASVFDAPERAPWRAAAERPSMLWVSLALNRVLGRAPYDKQSSRVREATVVEHPSSPEAFVWIEPTWALAALALRSFGKTGWPCRITGAPEGGVLEDLPVREIDHRGGERVAVPTESFIATETQRALARFGLTALASQPNSDATYVLTAPTAYVPPPKRAHEGTTTEPALRLPQAQLGDQLFVARLIHLVRAAGAELGARASGDELGRALEARVWDELGDAPPAGPELRISVRRDGEDLVADVTVRPRRWLGLEMEEITLGVPL